VGLQGVRIQSVGRPGAGNRLSDPKSQLRFGAFAPQGWKLEYSGWGAADAWARTVEISKRAEALGYDHLWVYDHVETVPRREATHVFEAFTTLAALSQQTEQIRLGQLVTCAAYRNAGLLAKEAAQVDVVSGGRLIFGLGAGWYEREYGAYGYEFPVPRDRLAALDETLDAVKRLWTEETVTLAGAHVHLDGAYCDPKPIQQLPEIWVGGGGERVTLGIAAKHADATNWQVGLDQFIHKSTVLREHCDRIGRDFDTIVRTHGPDCRLFESQADLAAWMAAPDGGDLWGGDGDPDEYVRDNLVGTAEQVIERVQAFVDAGCREFVLWFRDYPADESLERFAREVIPAVSG
jgi:F420-dependent oxidoreductase-like protein